MQAGAKANLHSVDVALYESVLCSMMEGCIPAYDRCGVVRGPSGAGVTGIVPTSAFEAKDGYVIIGGNNESIYTRLMQKIGREDLLGPEYNSNAKRVARQKEIEAAITAWTLKHSVQDVILAMEEVRVPCGPVNSVKDSELWLRQGSGMRGAQSFCFASQLSSTRTCKHAAWWRT